jgi:hypothetical protein
MRVKESREMIPEMRGPHYSYRAPRRLASTSVHTQIVHVANLLLKFRLDEVRKFLLSVASEDFSQPNLIRHPELDFVRVSLFMENYSALPF